MSQLWLDGLLRKMENTGFFQVRKSTNLCLTFKDTEHDLLEDPVVEDMIQAVTCQDVEVENVTLLSNFRFRNLN